MDSDWLYERGILAPLKEPVTKLNSKLSLPDARIFKTLQVHRYCYVRRRGNPLSTRTSTTHERHSMHRYKTIEKRYRGENCCWTIQNETHLTPRICPQKSDSILPFTFQRFPLRQCFGLTINKAQGQTSQVVGLDLRTPVFRHGMLYVALSRTGRKDAIHILTEGEVKSNVVYPEALDFGRDL